MSSQFDFVINQLFHNSSKDFMENLPFDFWDQCRPIVNDLRHDPDMYCLIQELYIENYRDYLGKVFDEFWLRFMQKAKPEKKNVSAHHRVVFFLVEYLETMVLKWLSNPFIDLLFVSKLEHDVNAKERKQAFVEKLQGILYTSFIADMPLTFSNFLLNTFSFSFKVFDFLNHNFKSHISAGKNLSMKKRLLDCLESLECGFNGDESDSNSECYCVTVCKGFYIFRNTLRELGIFDRLCEDIIRSVIFTSIEKHIYHLCEGNNFDISCLDATFTWFENNLIDWIKMVYLLTEGYPDQDMVNVIISNKAIKDSEGYQLNSIRGNNSSMPYTRVLSQVHSLSSVDIRNFIINTYVYCRMKQLFDIIIDYPYSEAVLIDLHECIKIDPFYRKQFIHTLKSSIETRLLHPGVSTSDIIEAYITAIKALKLLDPQGIILQIVCDPVRNYLKCREDTVRCIITSLTNENLIDLGEPTEAHGTKEIKDDDEQVLDTWKTWEPQPIGVSKLNKTLVNADIISMLVNIFDSKDLFVQEYQRLLSQRLLMTHEVNLEIEHRNLELLSLRFGESELHTCEVMLKDIKDSERVNQRINSGEFTTASDNEFETNGMILSQQFWPDNFGFAQTLDDLKVLKLPEEINEAFEAYTKSFETIKANRTLNWVHQLGMVKLELELNNGQNTVEFQVRPIQAAIIYQFQKRKLWRISELGEELTLLPSVIRRQIGYWQNLGLLVEVSPDTFLLDEEARNSSATSNQQSQTASQEFDHFDTEITDEEGTRRPNEDDNRLQIFWNFIDNMLKNLHALTLDRIFAMLKMFNMQSSEIESLTMHELRQFLDRKVNEDKLEYQNGLYSLKTDSSDV